jgi:hypothetical protein
MQIASSGWNLKGLESILIKAFKGKIGDNKTPESWEEVIPSFKENCSAVITNTEDVTIAKLYHKELDGTLSEVYIPWQNQWQATDNKSGVNKATNDTNHILFTKNHGVYNQTKHICIIRDSGFSSEGGAIQDMRGIAQYSVEDGIRYNRVRNGIGNKMQLVGSPMFESQNGQSADKFKMTVSQGFILLPNSHRLIERQPAFDIGTHINVLRFEEGEFNRDTQQYDATIQGRLTSRPNKGEVQRVTEEVQFTDNAKNNIKFRDYSAVFLSVLNRMPSVKCKESDVGYNGKKKFYDLIKKNLEWLVKEDEDVDKLLDAINSFVMDPVTTNIETISIALGMAETPFARNRLKRMLLIAKGMPIEEVNHTVPLITDKFSNMQDERIAIFENDMFFTTNEAMVAGTDDHIKHLDKHIDKCSRVIEAFKNGQLSPMDAFKYLENNVMHCSQHIDLLGRDKTFNDTAKEYLAALKAIVKAKDQIKQVAQQQMEQQAQAQEKIQLDPETESDIASKNAKALADTQRKDWLAQQRTSQRDKQIEMSHEQRMREIELRYQNEQE